MIKWSIYAAMLYFTASSMAFPGYALNADGPRTLQESEASDDPSQQFEIAYNLFIEVLEEGLETEVAQSSPELKKACNLAKEAGENGIAEATNLYATCVSQGYGEPANGQRAYKILLEASEAGSVGAKLTLAEWHLSGNDIVVQDHQRAFQYTLSAAEESNESEPDSYAQWKVGMLYLDGTGVEQNSEEAFKWVVRGSDNGSTSAMISRAVMLATGDGTTENDEEARLWYEKVALSGEVNFAHGLRGLGFMMFFGEGGPEDPVTGYGYLLVAKAAGDENAAKLIDQVEGQLSDAQIASAFEVANNWTEKYLNDE